MSIYSPVSSISNAILGVGGSLLGGLTSRLGANLGTGLAGQLGAAALGQVGHAASRRLAGVVQPWANQADGWLNGQFNRMLSATGLNLFSDDVALSEGALNIAGGLSFRDMWDAVQEVDTYTLARKHFYVLEINDRSGQAPTAQTGKHSLFNLLTTQLSFSPVTINSEAVSVGSIELDKLQSSGRTEMSLTCLDDDAGSIKNWAKGRASAVAPSDGTFAIPFMYLFDVKVIFGTNVENASYYNESFTMRLTEMGHELSRSEQALEEVTLKFTQWDTCIPSYF